MSNKKIILIFSALIIFQLVFSLIFSPYSNNECWKSLDVAGSYKGRSVAGFDQKVLNSLSGMLKNYRLNCDAGGYMLLAHDFPKDYFRGRSLFINRPLYSFIVYLFAQPFHLISDSYSITFAAGLLVNCVMLLISCWLLFKLLKNFFTERVSLISCILLILSPFAHSWLAQPETNIFGAFSVVVVLYLLYDYSIKPSLNKVFIYSFISGLFLLGKMNVALAFFIIPLGLFVKKYRELIYFVIFYSLPTILWYLLVTQIWGLNFGVQEISNFKAGVWIFDALHWPLIQNLAITLDVLPKFINSIIYGFFPVPVIFALVGYYFVKIKHKHLIFCSMVISYLLLFFALNIYLPRHAFLLFPIIYPLAVFGIDHINGILSKYKYFNSKVYYIVVYAIIIFPSLVNIAEIYNQLNIPYS